MAVFLHLQKNGCFSCYPLLPTPTFLYFLFSCFFYLLRRFMQCRAVGFKVHINNIQGKTGNVKVNKHITLCLSTMYYSTFPFCITQRQTGSHQPLLQPCLSAPPREEEEGVNNIMTLSFISCPLSNGCHPTTVRPIHCKQQE